MATLLFLCLLFSSAVFTSADDAPTSPGSDNSQPADTPGPPDTDYTTQLPPTSAQIPLDPDTKIKVIIEGVVLCQDCSTRGTWNLYNSKPIQGAKVSVTCRDAKNRPVGYQAVEADQNGYFYAPYDVGSIADYYSGDPTKACFVRLLSSPDQGCNALTNINWGIVGAPAIYTGKYFTGPDYTTVILEVGSLAFRPGWCPLSG